MWGSIFINIIISILIIFILHSLWNYVKNTYSTKKTKDLVGSQIQKYKNMIEELQKQPQQQNPDPFPDTSMEKDLEKWMEENLQNEFQNNNI